MKKIFLLMSFAVFVWSCNDSKEKAGTTTTDTTSKMTVDLPYTASYSSSFTDDVSDADLKTVLVSYKDWADGNMSKLSAALGDTLSWERSDGQHFRLPNAGIMKMWGDYRDSLSSVTIDMQAWKKMYATDKKEAFVVTWYKEIDTYKGGNKVDSVYMQDINMVKDGKITALEQYKRPAK